MAPSRLSEERNGARERGLAGDSSKSLQKALRILLHMGKRAPEAGVTQLAAELSLNKSTVHRLLTTMERFELIERNAENERYRLGLKLHELGSKALEGRTLRSEAHRLLLEMSRRSQESVSLAVPTRSGVICMDRVDSPHTVITVRTPVGALFPAHCTAAGKAVLAFLPESEANEILRRNGLKSYTPVTMTRISELKDNLKQIRQRGFAADHQELERGLSGVAAPVRIGEGRVLAAVGIAGPTPRFRGSDLKSKIALVKEIADRLGQSLGR